METGKKIIPENRQKESQDATAIFDEKAVFRYEFFLQKPPYRILIKERQVRDKKEHFERQQHKIIQITSQCGLDLKDKVDLLKEELHLCVLE